MEIASIKTGKGQTIPEKAFVRHMGKRLHTIASKRSFGGRDTLLKDELVEACFKLTNPCTCHCHLHRILKQDVNVKDDHILFRPVLHQK